MKCKQIQTRLADYSAQRLAPSEAGEIRSHLEVCGACSLFLREEGALAGGLERLSAVEPRAELWGRVMAGLDAPQHPARHVWRFGWGGGRKPLAAFAAGMAAVAGLVAFTQFGAFDASPSERAPVAQRAPAKVSPAPVMVPVMNPEVNPEVDDPMSEQMDSLLAAVDHMTQDN